MSDLLFSQSVFKKIPGRINLPGIFINLYDYLISLGSTGS